jgi:hypothetical protein
MSKTLEVFTSPLFYDALSEPFLPPTDPQGRKHTLGRLSVAAVNKGEAGGRYGRVYRPSWAPVSAAVTMKPIGPDNYQIIGLNVTDLNDSAENPQSLSVAHADLGDSPALNLYLDTDDHPTALRLPFTLGDDLNTARYEVAKAAQTFFDSLRA